MLDLHMHSTASDGTDTPSVIMTKSSKLKLSLCSITDHDTIDGQKEAIDVAKKLNINYITGIEFSVRHIGELHILGYGIDINNAVLKEKMEELRLSRLERVDQILKRLHEKNVRITKEDVIRHSHGNTLGRPHIAKALEEKGYVSDTHEAFTKYLNEDGLCYVTRKKITQKEAFDLILGAGGSPVIAHPKFIQTDDLESLIKEAKDMGLAGIEAYYPKHNDAEAAKYEKIAKKYGLIVTQGSDYHGSMRPMSAIACEKRETEYLKDSIRFLMKKHLL